MTRCFSWLLLLKAAPDIQLLTPSSLSRSNEVWPSVLLLLVTCAYADTSAALKRLAEFCTLGGTHRAARFGV